MLRQFGPALQLPWSKLEAPELTDELIAALVDGVTKLERIEFESREAQQAASMRKMLLAMADGDISDKERERCTEYATALGLGSVAIAFALQDTLGRRRDRLQALGEHLVGHARQLGLVLLGLRTQRVHLDRVEGLGDHLELETVVDGITTAEAEAESGRMIESLGLGRPHDHR